MQNVLIPIQRVAYYGPSRQRLRTHHEIKPPYKALLTSQLLGDTLGFLLHKAVYLMENPVYIVNTMSMFDSGPTKNYPNLIVLIRNVTYLSQNMLSHRTGIHEKLLTKNERENDEGKQLHDKMKRRKGMSTQIKALKKKKTLLQCNSLPALLKNKQSKPNKGKEESVTEF